VARERSDLNIDKIDTPLRVVAKKGAYVIPMWEPFALLKASGKPAEFAVLNIGDGESCGQHDRRKR